MRSEELAGLPGRPPSVAEWEDLLVRFEIMPRALRAALDAPAARPERVAAPLRELLSREREVGRWLETAAGWTPSEPSTPGSADAQLDARELADRFAAVRARNFAMLQRRGVDVWEWSGLTRDGAPATVFQLLSWMLRADALALAALREPGATLTRAGAGG